jgi:hypothetical protein
MSCCTVALVPGGLVQRVEDGSELARAEGGGGAGLHDALPKADLAPQA